MDAPGTDAGIGEDERARLFRAIVEHANDAVVICEARPIEPPGPRIVYVNAAFERLTGWSAAEVLGKTPRVLQGPRTSRPALDRIRRALERWEPVTVDLVNYRRDGTEFVVENSIMPVAARGEWPTHWVSIQRDITDRHRADAELRASEERFRKSFDEGPLGMALVRLDDVIERANAVLGRMVGRPRDRLRGERLASLAHPDDADLDARATLALVRGSGTSFQVDKRLLTTDGAVVWARCTTALIHDADGAPSHLLVTFEDDTARRADREALVRAREEAERSARARTAFLANVTHELRTPLHAVLGFGRVLERAAWGPLNDRQREYLGHLLESGDHMLGLVEALLDLRRLEEGRTVLRVESVDVRDPIDRAVRMVESLSAARRQTLAVNVAPDLPRALCDAGALVQALANLLTNAVKFSPEASTVTVRARAWQARVTVSVEDAGPGIAAAEQERVFEYLEQADAEVPATLRGAGIGLALTRALVRHMGGTLGLRSAPGRGSAFTVTLRPALRGDTP